jgi:NAD-dependent deacetylase
MGYRSIVILTGAGISAESGIQTFRAADGLWENHRVEDVASPEGYERNPGLVQRFYNERRRQLLSNAVQPNAAHRALAKLEAEFPGDVTLVTQNIDDLHERGGSKKVIHMHGELLKMFCTRSKQVFSIRDDIGHHHRCECCQQAGTLRPDIVWFGEIPCHMEAIGDALARCDLFISIGTSGNVYPAAGFVSMANQVGAHTVEINLEPSRVQSRFKEKIYGKAGDVLPKYMERLLLRK